MSGLDRENVALAGEVGTLLRERGMTLATAESCTGGLLSATLTAVPGASEWFREGVVTYADGAKIRILGVPAGTISSHGAVSRETAEAMAEGVLRISGAEIAVAITGIAGPGGGTPAKPVGTVFVALTDGEGTVVREHHFTGDRDGIRHATVGAALSALRERLRKERS